MAKAFSVLKVKDNTEAAVLQVCLENYFSSSLGNPLYRNSARHMLKRLNRELEK